MQRVIEKMAKQLLAYDEASLMQLWQHYALQVNDFEPTRKWEEAAVALCLIQSVHWKNQLFNYQLAATANPADPADASLLAGLLPKFENKSEESENTGPKNKATVLRFTPKNTD